MKSNRPFETIRWWAGILRFTDDILTQHPARQCSRLGLATRNLEKHPLCCFKEGTDFARPRQWCVGLSKHSKLLCLCGGGRSPCSAQREKKRKIFQKTSNVSRNVAALLGRHRGTPHPTVRSANRIVGSSSCEGRDCPCCPSILIIPRLEFPRNLAH